MQHAGTCYRLLGGQAVLLWTSIGCAQHHGALDCLLLAA
jgi:hypothetical protein